MKCALIRQFHTKTVRIWDISMPSVEKHSDSSLSLPGESNLYSPFQLRKLWSTMSLFIPFQSSCSYVYEGYYGWRLRYWTGWSLRCRTVPQCETSYRELSCWLIRSQFTSVRNCGVKMQMNSDRRGEEEKWREGRGMLSIVDGLSRTRE